jgi:hypothetical protein
MAKASRVYGMASWHGDDFWAGGVHGGDLTLRGPRIREMGYRRTLLAQVAGASMRQNACAASSQMSFGVPLLFGCYRA